MGRHESIPVRWKNGQNIKELILNAYRSGESVEIDYLKTEAEDRSTRRIDIKVIKNNQIQAFCHLKQAVRIFNIDKIFDVKTIGRQGNWQNKLF